MVVWYATVKEVMNLQEVLEEPKTMRKEMTAETPLGRLPLSTMVVLSTTKAKPR